MKLLLTSSGITNKSIKKALLGLVGKPFSQLHLTFIPTAANIEAGDKSWLVDDMYNFRKLGFSSFDIVDLSVASKDIWLPSFEKADVLVFGGGNVNYLLSWIQKSGLKDILAELLITRVYVGISAGSMATANIVSLSSASILYYEQTGNLENTKGLGLVDFEIRPHLNSQWFPKARIDYFEKISSTISNTFYAIDDNTAIEVIDGKIAVISEGEWKKFN